MTNGTEPKIRARGGGRRPHGPVPHPGPRRDLGRRAGRGGGHRLRAGAAGGRRPTGRAPSATIASSRASSTSPPWRSPPSSTSTVARDLLEAGVHVLVEKPMTSTLEQAKELFRVARQQRRVLHVGHVERFNGAVQELRKIVERPDPHRVPAARPVRAARAERLGGDGPHDPRHRHRARPGGRRAAQDHRGRLARCTRRSTDVANVQIVFDSGAMATITASRATEEKIRTLAITQPDAYILLDYSHQDIQIHRRAAQEYTLNRESIRYRQASFVEHLLVHKDNPLKLEIRHLVSAARAAEASGPVELPEADDLRSLAVALEIERMIREGRGETAWPEDLPWSVARPDGRGRDASRPRRPEARRHGWRVVAFAFEDAPGLGRRRRPRHPLGHHRYPGGAHEPRRPGRRRPPSSWASSGSRAPSPGTRGGRGRPRPGPRRPLRRGARAMVVATLAGMGIEVLDQRQFLARGCSRPARSPPARPSEEWEEIREGFRLAGRLAEDGSARRWCAREG